MAAINPDAISTRSFADSQKTRHPRTRDSVPHNPANLHLGGSDETNADRVRHFS